MKLEEIMETKQPDGTYAGVNFSKQTVDKLQQYIKENDIPNGLTADKMHCTVLYSRKYLPNYQPQGKIDPPFEGKPTKLEKWETQPDENGKTSQCLVMRFNCPQLVERHKHLMQEHDAMFDFDEYRPHATLSYDVGDMDVADLSNVADTVDSVVIEEEYGEDLNLDWAADKKS